MLVWVADEDVRERECTLLRQRRTEGRPSPSVSFHEDFGCMSDGPVWLAGQVLRHVVGDMNRDMFLEVCGYLI
jgi:hypothetical protein